MAMVAWKEDTRYMGLRWQLADLLRTVTHRTTSVNLCGYWQGAADRIEDQVWTVTRRSRSRSTFDRSAMALTLVQPTGRLGFEADHSPDNAESLKVLRFHIFQP
ncbi:hypothetical protein AJ87_27225 [Rhizobium yanglingense]|nr:hypothetical protein AJ87_27225 [Rhizobium yanglingense]